MKALKHRNVNLLKSYTKKPELTTKKRDLLLMLIPVAVMAIGLAAMLIAMSVKLADINKKIAAEDEYLDNPEVLAKYQEYEELTAELAEVQSLHDELAAGEYAVNSYPEFVSSLIDDALAAATRDITLTAYAYSDDGGVLSFSGTTYSVLSVSEYVKALDAIGCFSYVDYYGYASQNGRQYAFTAYCVIDRGEQNA